LAWLRRPGWILIGVGEVARTWQQLLTGVSSAGKKKEPLFFSWRNVTVGWLFVGWAGDTGCVGLPGKSSALISFHLFYLYSYLCFEFDLNSTLISILFCRFYKFLNLNRI
jgi:hypothetical protein